jgi:hypothetical protein
LSVAGHALVTTTQVAVGAAALTAAGVQNVGGNANDDDGNDRETHDRYDRWDRDHSFERGKRH